MNTSLTTQLAREQQRRMLTEASRQHRHGHTAPTAPGAAVRIIRSLTAPIAWTSARPRRRPTPADQHPLTPPGKPAAPAQTSARSR